MQTDDDDTELKSEHIERDEARLLHSAALHAEPSASLISRDEVQLETPDYDSISAAAATAAADDVVGLETIAGSAQMSNQGVCMYVTVCNSVYIVSSSSFSLPDI